jgi:hypothetical protein
MGRCPTEKLKDIQGALEEIRRWPGIVEPSTGTFYIKRVPFLHFHEKDGRRWADLKRAGGFVPIDLPFGLSAAQLRKFLKTVQTDFKKGTS